MKPEPPENVRVLGIAASGDGFGFALLDGSDLINWGLKEPGKATGCADKAESLLKRYKPDVLVMEDFRQTKRGVRARILIQKVIDLAPIHGAGVKLFTRQQVYEGFFASGDGTKDVLAEILARRFPDELGLKLPPKRQFWEREDRWMPMFDAVALALISNLFGF